MMVTAAIWPARDYSRVPYRLYHDPEIYAREQERIFRGPTWSFLGLEAEIPDPGDFRTTWVGDTPVVVNRDQQGAVAAFVNRCAHRGAMVRRELSGNAREHVCIYHQWCYGLDGRLTAIPFRRGIRGKGGLDAGFDMGEHGLHPLRVGVVAGAVFGTLAEEAEPLEEFLGAPIVAQLERLLARPVRVLGYNRQRIRANWKLYAENTRDNYHASLLHEFLVTFGLDRSTQVGGVKMDPRHRHSITWAEADSDTDEFAREAYAGARVRTDHLALQEPALVAFRPERNDRLNLVVDLGVSVGGLRADQQQPGDPPDPAARARRGRGVPDNDRLRRRSAGDDLASPAPGQSGRPGRARLDGGWRGDRDRPSRLEAGAGPRDGHRIGRRRGHLRPRLSGQRRAVARLLVVLRRIDGDRAGGCGAMTSDRRPTWPDRAAIHDLFAEYGALLDLAKYDEWLGLFTAECRYNVVSRENSTAACRRR